MKKFALIGLAGYIAPKHLKAIKDTDNELVAAFDKNDNVGIIDTYFPKTHFFTEFEIFDRHISKIRFNEEEKIDFISICTPNYLHDSNIRFALQQGADAICEKPLVLNPWNLDALSLIEQETHQKIHTILQLRLHPSILKFKALIENSPKDKKHQIDLTYITSRGNWYYSSWKSNINKSGGIASNIGIHFFDMLAWIFGKVQKNTVHLHTHDRASGILEFKNAQVRWFLSINAETLPKNVQESGQTTYRSLVLDGAEIEFSNGFEELHTESYKQILAGNGFGIEESRSSIEIIHDIRVAEIQPLQADYHPFLKLEKSSHPYLK